MNALKLLHSALNMLKENVEEGKVYLLRRGEFDGKHRSVELLEVDKDHHTFVTVQLLKEVEQLTQ